MKQTILRFLSKINTEILTMPQSLYDNKNSYEYITQILRKYDFLVKDNYMNLKGTFQALKGSKQPKITFICKYDSGSPDGHIYGNNCNATISIGTAIALSSIIEKMDFSIEVIGCSGIYSSGPEIILTKEHAFDDSSVIFAPHVDNITSLNNSSLACTTLEITYINRSEKPDVNTSCLDFCLHTIHFINQLIEDTSKHCYMDHLSLRCDNAVREYPTSAKAEFEIKGDSFKICSEIEDNIRKYIKCLKDIMNVSCSVSLSKLPCKELLDNSTINKLFENNLKESGLIDINYGKNVIYPLCIGTVSHSTPTIYPSINICNDNKIHCPSLEFRDQTTTDLAKDNIWKAISALSFTCIDVIEKRDLISESTWELNNNLIE